MFTPPVVGDPNGKWPGAINLVNGLGGANWPGAAYYPETHIFYSEAQQAALSVMSLREPPLGLSDMRYLSGRQDQLFGEAFGPGFGTAADSPLAKTLGRPQTGGGGSGALNVQGLSLVKPPYSVITAVSLNRGEIIWQVPYGETPDSIRNHPVLKGMNIPNTGQLGSVGVLVTKTLIVVSDTSSRRHRGILGAPCFALTIGHLAKKCAPYGCLRPKVARP
jgi:quinoprotein glucose dehydrogenase